MKNTIKTIAAVAIIFVSGSLFAQEGNEIKLENEFDTASYMMGLYVGSTFKDIPAGDKIDLKLVQEGLGDSFDETPLFSMEEVQAFMAAFMSKQQAMANEESKKTGLKEETEFLAANKEKEGVIETESGLQYKVLREGTGISPLATDEVEVHYTGRLLDGTVFDSSVERGESISFKLNQVIAGWTEGVQLMKEGSKYEFYIPHNLAYGERGAGGVIAPYSTLIFEVELIKVNKDEQ